MKATTTYVSSTQLNLKITVSSSATPGTYNLFVTDSDGLQGKCANCLTVTAKAGAAGGRVLALRFSPLAVWTYLRRTQ